MTKSSPAPTLFPTRLPACEWQQFAAAGYTKPACGVIYRLEDTVTNGMALGGIDTGCLDLETSGLLGYCTLFNTHVPRRGPLNVPLLGLSVGGRTWVLCDPKPKEGSGGSQTPLEPGVSELNFDGVETASQIHYWGHYPVADLEFETATRAQAPRRAPWPSPSPAPPRARPGVSSSRAARSPARPAACASTDRRPPTSRQSSED